MAKKKTTAKKKPEKTNATRAKQATPDGFIPAGPAWGVIILARPCWLMNTDGFIWWTPYESVARAQANYEGSGHEARPMKSDGQPGPAK